MKNKQLQNILVNLTIASEIAKNENLISDYQIKTERVNPSIASDGVLEHDVLVTEKIMVKKPVRFINLKFELS
jgi:hypothetical protein